MLSIKIAVGDLSLDGELNDTECARALARVLPVTAEFHVWGDELHFDVDLEDDPRARRHASVRVGDMGFWHEGSTLCIFFGPTPLSAQEEPVAPVPITVVGRISDVDQLRAYKESGKITVSAPNGHNAGAG